MASRLSTSSEDSDSAGLPSIGPEPHTDITGVADFETSMTDVARTAAAGDCTAANNDDKDDDDDDDDDDDEEEEKDGIAVGCGTACFCIVGCSSAL